MLLFFKNKEKKYQLITIISLIFFVTCSANNFKSLNLLLKKYRWEKRILLVIAKSEKEKIVYETKKYFDDYHCENEERNLKMITIIESKLKNFYINQQFHDKFGIWLIGYDGDVKIFSKNSSILKKIHQVIDMMPIRQDEIKLKKTTCN